MTVSDAPSGTYPVHPQTLPSEDVTEGKYRVAFARDARQLEAAQRLRFEVFNLEMNEGLEESYATGMDQDRFDPVCHHLLVEEVKTGAIVGTYRMQTSEMAAEYHGFYSAEEFDFSTLDRSLQEQSVEVGRACVAKEHRNRMVLFLLWKGLARYIMQSRKRYLFGCCSLTSQDPVEAKLVLDYLEAGGHLHPTLRLAANPEWRCLPPDFELSDEQRGTEVTLPRLFKTYLRYGAKVCSEPALDRHFKTIDYLVLFDHESMDESSRGMFFDAAAR